MSERKSYTGIDCFRLFAAFLIVAIHTSPLLSFSETGDFILTRIIARLAVPFFFLTSGFFLISRYSNNSKKRKNFVKKTVLLYGISILIYLPVNLYNHYFEMEYFAPNFIKDILFDGTFYHLWYLPASIIGAEIAWFLVKKLDYRRAFIVSFLFYLIGLFGDSYYGFAKQAAEWKGFYDLIFQISDYTRNGVFFATVFFVMGGWFADCRRRSSFTKNCCGFLVSFSLMFAEAFCLHFFRIARHDSMYVFLLPCMYFLFQMILQFQGKRLMYVRTMSLILYIIHPMMILAVWILAKIVHLQKLLIENSLVHYFMVCLLSAIFAAAVSFLQRNYCSKKKVYQFEKDRSYIEINLRNLEHNVKVLRQVMPPYCKLMAVVKTEAYGHGAYEISVHLNKMGVRAFAAASIDEGIRLRKYGIKGEILILGYTAVHRAADLKKYDLTQTLIDFAYAKELNRQNKALKVHIKIDTGMHRLGMDALDTAKVKQVFAMKNLNVIGIFTHLSCADSRLTEDIAFTKRQIERFYELIDELKRSGITVPKLHMLSSYGLLNYPNQTCSYTCSYVRAGIALYGVKSLPFDRTVLKLDLRPVLSLKSRVILIRFVSKGDFVGYGRGFLAERDSRIAILPIGYGDGYPRSLSYGKGKVRIRGYLVPVIGRICMDQLAVDITDTKDIAVGDTAVLISSDTEDEISAPALAESFGSISNELLCRMGARLPVVIK